MTQVQGTVIWRQIRALAQAQCPSHQEDGQLLETFVTQRDESAFAAIVQRHGAMVLAVCRSVLHHWQDAEDVFQAAFLVLARKAHTIRKHEALGSWLHGVAYRLALKARARARRVEMLTDLSEPASTTSVDDLTYRELRAILHEELNRLPEEYRASLLLCYWEGKTRDEAAERLGVSSGKFKKCLERARRLLGSRLVSRGLAPSAVFSTAIFLDSSIRAAVSNVLINNTAQAAAEFAAGKAISAGVSTAAVALANGALQMMNVTKWATTLVAVLLFAGLTTGLSVAAYQAVVARNGEDGAANFVEQQLSTQAQKAGKKTDAERLVGTWIFVDGRANGEPIPNQFTTLARMVFEKNGTLIMRILDDGKKGSYKIVEAGKIDLTQGNDAASPGIYKFEGEDRVSICVASDGGGKATRPTDFTAEKDSRQTLFVLRRAKAGEEKPAAADLAKVGGIDKIREAAARQVCANNMKQIAIAFHNYHDTHGSLPAHAIYSKDGKTPLLSWRVALLPYLDHAELYRAFKLDEPWDSEHNKKLISKMPRVFEPPFGGKKDPGQTLYQVFSGPDTVFDGINKMKFNDITDGTSNTVFAAEAKEAVIWSKPADIVMPKDKQKLPALGGMFSNGFHIMMADGSVRMVPLSIEPAVLRPLITPRGKD